MTYSLYVVNKSGTREDRPVAQGDSQRALIFAGAAFKAWDLVDASGQLVCSRRPRQR